MRPFNVVSGSGFAKVAQELINIGARHGSIEIQDILPHRTTVSRKLIELAEEVRKTLMPEAAAAKKEHRRADIYP
ncbi:hypothetical protein HPB50_014231 [Hyalomma asiaticum]|uniref:Uncharacterized protein n=1 Tax=Hyalomma asiaticum TaxID=266040 RepID=A0ACB7RUF9_HYAAI|nr:hypothetical protein HPB50_014231 [Hyalomma asiaticum]